MVGHVLDNPVLTALNDRQATLGRTSELAAVYAPQVSPFAGIAEPSAAALTELARLVNPGAGIGVLSTEPQLPVTPAWQPEHVIRVHQMICESPPAAWSPWPANV